MSEDDFNKASNRKTYKHLKLTAEDREKLDEIEKRQRKEIKELKKAQRERREEDFAAALQKILLQHPRPELKPEWDKGRHMTRDQAEKEARKKVAAENAQELHDLNTAFEKEKSDLVSWAFLEDRAVLETDRKQQKRDRDMTRHRSKRREKGDRGR